jgi:hypothetical protein
VVKKIRWNFEKALDITVFQGGDDGRGYGNESNQAKPRDLVPA